MKSVIRVMRTSAFVGAGLLPVFGACVTTNQLRDFIRGEIAAVGTQILIEPVNDELSDLIGPQIVEEIVPSI